VSGNLNLEKERMAPYPAVLNSVLRVASLVSVEEGYARWAASYDHTPNPLLAREERHLLNLLPPLRHRRALDLACGTGRWLEKVAAQRPSLGVGVDLSDAMLGVAATKSALARRLACADCLRLPFCDNAFDLVICSFAVSHIRDLRGIAEELARVTKPSANVFISDVHPEARASGWTTGFRDGRGSTQIEIQPHSQKALAQAFYTGSFECMTHETLCFGEEEKPIFDLAGKSHLFAEASRVPAILVCHFQRVAKKSDFSRSQP
jgi:ubiquinone/menaquinone biosynthesis C-methylase UbiE